MQAKLTPPTELLHWMSTLVDAHLHVKLTELCRLWGEQNLACLHKVEQCKHCRSQHACHMANLHMVIHWGF
jgi:hypothetical protein